MSKNIPYVKITGTNYQLLSNTDLQALFANAGVLPTDTIVAYCHIGQQATGIVFAARLLGRPVLLYDGFFEDWSRHLLSDFPVENPSAKGNP